MILKRAKTRNGNYLVFQVDENGPTGKGCYTTPEGALMERTERSAKAERNWAKKKWDAYEEEDVPHEVYAMHTRLFSERPQETSFGRSVPNTPFADLAEKLAAKAR